eukprot:1161767-Pelagomonas_calceolata.AAC.1
MHDTVEMQLSLCARQLHILSKLALVRTLLLQQLLVEASSGFIRGQILPIKQGVSLTRLCSAPRWLSRD